MKPHFKCPNAHMGSDNPLLDQMSDSQGYSLGAPRTAPDRSRMPDEGSCGVTISKCNLHRSLSCCTVSGKADTHRDQVTIPAKRRACSQSAGAASVDACYFVNDTDESTDF